MTPTVAKLVLPGDGAGDMGDKRANETMFCVPDKPWEVNAGAGDVGWSGSRMREHDVPRLAWVHTIHHPVKALVVCR
jgi:hypothetical protein